MATTNFKEYECELEWAKVFSHNMDKGSDDNDAARKVKEMGGMYSVDMIVTDEVKEKMIKDGVPDVSMGYQMFKDEGEGKWRYKAKRYHLSNFTDEATGERVVLGPPNVVDLKETLERNEAVKWDEEVLIGNGTKAHVKLRIYKNGNKRIITLASVGVLDLVEYEGEVKW